MCKKLVPYFKMFRGQLGTILTNKRFMVFLQVENREVGFTFRKSKSVKSFTVMFCTLLGVKV